MKVLVTGHRGFVAGHLLKELEEHDVYGFDLKDGQDFRDYEQVRAVVDDVRPDWIFHLGAMAYVPESFLDPYRAIETNTIGSLNILEAVRKVGLKSHIHLCGTSEEYGDGGPNETDTPNPLSPYAIAKLGMTHLGRLYAQSYGMNVVVTRTFNHTGPGRGEQYAEAAFAKQIAEIEQGKRQILEHGELSSIRNYTDVRDVVRAYKQAIVLPSGVYNICSTTNVTMREVLDTLISKASVPIQTEQRQSLLRPADFSFQQPSAAKFTGLTGWQPTISLRETLEDILNEWREKL